MKIQFWAPFILLLFGLAVLPAGPLQALAFVSKKRCGALFDLLPQNNLPTIPKRIQRAAKNCGTDESSVTCRVVKIVSEQLEVKESDVKSSASFVNDLGADSLSIVELILAFEEEFECEIPDEDAEKFKTVGDAVAYLTAHCVH